MLYQFAERIASAETSQEEILAELESIEEEAFHELEHNAQELELTEQFNDAGESAESSLDIITSYLGGTREDWQRENFDGPETYFRNNEIIYADNQSLTKEII